MSKEATNKVIEISRAHQTVTTMDDVDQMKLIAIEIKMIDSNMKQQLLFGVVQIGKRLCEAKKLIGHGNFADWCTTELDYSQRTANNYMKIFKEYGENGLLEKSQSIANLNYTQAVKLLAIPEEDRAEFAEENDVQNLKITELTEKINALQNENNEKDKALESVKKEMEGLQEREATFIKESLLLKDHASNLVNQIEELKKQSAELKESGDKEIKAAIDQAIAEKETELIAKNELISGLENQIKENQESQASMKTAIEEDAAIKANQEAEKKWSAEIQKLQEDLTQAENNIEKAKADANQEAEKAFSAEKNALQKQIKQAQGNEEKAKKEVEKAQKQIVDIAKATSTMKVSTMYDQIVSSINLFKKAVKDLEKISKDDAEKFTADLKDVIAKF